MNVYLMFNHENFLYKPVGTPYQISGCTLECILDEVWEKHYVQLLTTTFPKIEVMAKSATESSWRSYVFSDAEDILVLNPKGLEVESYDSIESFFFF